jgi:hypothetical protein
MQNLTPKENNTIKKAWVTLELSMNSIEITNSKVFDSAELNSVVGPY